MDSCVYTLEERNTFHFALDKHSPPYVFRFRSNCGSLSLCPFFLCVPYIYGEISSSGLRLVTTSCVSHLAVNMWRSLFASDLALFRSHFSPPDDDDDDQFICQGSSSSDFSRGPFCVRQLDTPKWLPYIEFSIDSESVWQGRVIAFVFNQEKRGTIDI